MYEKTHPKLTHSPDPCSCSGETAIQKSREVIEKYYSEPVLTEYYGEATVTGWHQAYEEIPDNEGMLESHKEFILDKLANAQAEMTLQEAMGH